MKHLELFAGIGGFRKAFDIFGEDLNLTMNCVGYSELDVYANKTYTANYNTENETILGDIVEFTSHKKNIEKLEDFDILTGGFPCQSFSMMGKQKGFNDVRGNVFFNIIKILKVKKPKFILLENVKNIITHDKGNTIKVIEEEIKKAGYKNVFFNVFNTENFGLAQKRNRVFIFATTEDLPKDFVFNEKVVIENFKNIKKSSLLKQKNTLDVLAKEVEEKYYLSETLKPTILSNGSKNFKSKSEINQLVARPLTATMVKMHRACQDNYFSHEFLNSEKPLEYLKTEYSKEEQAKHRIRKLTPHEAFLLQGFNGSFVSNAKEKGVSNHQLYKQAGNAVSVNTVYAVLHYLFIKKDLIKYVL
ncbi:MAG: DNA (cytosine-5-)-methyltransferase [Pedobacter sp.]|uniref:DNA (cytosine-5-)-methyltransferase n=1 Tax=Pedobacter sp. TaxID=1411316 RepID=UPI002806832D|nr:DNA (cytosine-5-)-methyltransferase [Pedobacter sp.]MDQ8004562.1 DNA (cytosine-5-)-methyltransferase [Pedobacter sp.]